MKQISVTQPALPPLSEFIPYLQDIWDRKWLTNNGYYHQELEKALCEYLGVKYISLFSNGTLALLTSLQALGITGEVITTPYSFVATTHSLIWNSIQPVFVDIEDKFLNIDPEKISSAITSNTSAIMPVHVYGNPCNVKRLKEIADYHNIKIIYDAAHAFGVKYEGNSILNYGDLSILSFHATKVYNTIEGGAIVCHSEEMKRHIDDLKNFGFRDEVTVVAAGINAKMNEIQSAYGLLQLNYIDENIRKRNIVAQLYRKELDNISGITILPIPSDWNQNNSYFPILVDSLRFGITRDELYEKLKSHNIFGRRYFYPLISSFPLYNNLPSSSINNLPIANKTADEVLCLPIYPDLTSEEVYKIVEIIKGECKWPG